MPQSKQERSEVRYVEFFSGIAVNIERASAWVEWLMQPEGRQFFRFLYDAKKEWFLSVASADNSRDQDQVNKGRFREVRDLAILATDPKSLLNFAKPRSAFPPEYIFLD